MRFYQKAMNHARALRAHYDRVLAEADLLLMPTTPMVATPLPAKDAPILERFLRASEATSNTQPFDVTHHPALSIPCGLVQGLPVGLMLVGRHFAEATLYRAAYAFEQSEDWRDL
jgi:amidase